MGGALVGIIFGFIAWFLVRYLVAGIYTVDQNQRAVMTSFGRAVRISEKATTLDDPIAQSLTEEERARYAYPQVQVIQPGPHFKLPWQKIYKVNVATQTVSIAFDAEDRNANQGGTVLEAVTKDQLNTGLSGQLRYRVCDRNLYAYLFGVKKPIAHVMGYFVSVLRERIATFEAPNKEAVGGDGSNVSGISINDLRKNLRLLNEHMDKECASSAARYGIVLDATLITEIDPPQEVESALAAINTAHNQVSSDISLAQASADQKIVESRRAVEIETLKAQAEVEPLERLSAQLSALRQAGGPGALAAYVRNVRLGLFHQAKQAFVEDRS
jgi:regulator of protease activity HflC (stomatin/prohibitin superfamily)